MWKIDSFKNLAVAVPYNLIADISWITGLAAGATGVVLLFTLKNDGDDEENASLSPWAAPGAAGASLRGSF